MAPMASAVISLGFIYLGDPRRRLCRTNSAYADALSSTEIINGHQVMTESMKNTFADDEGGLRTSSPMWQN